MISLASRSVSFTYTWFLQHILSTLEFHIHLKPEKRRRNGLHRKRKLLWRELSKIKAKIKPIISVTKLAKILQERRKIEAELKSMYQEIQMHQECKVIMEMKENP